MSKSNKYHAVEVTYSLYHDTGDEKSYQRTEIAHIHYIEKEWFCRITPQGTWDNESPRPSVKVIPVFDTVQAAIEYIQTNFKNLKQQYQLANDGNCHNFGLRLYSFITGRQQGESIVWYKFLDVDPAVFPSKYACVRKEAFSGDVCEILRPEKPFQYFLSTEEWVPFKLPTN